jgi:hypothetical protein
LGWLEHVDLWSDTVTDGLAMAVVAVLACWRRRAAGVIPHIRRWRWRWRAKGAARGPPCDWGGGGNYGMAVAKTLWVWRRGRAEPGCFSFRLVGLTPFPPISPRWG